MSIGDSITLVSCLAGLMVALPGLMVCLTMIFNRTTERAATRLSSGVIAPFFAGLIPLMVVGYVGFVLVAMGSILQLLGTVIILVLLAWGFAGMGVVGRLIGLKLTEATKQNHQPFHQSVIGAVILTFAIAFPLVGWFLVLPVSWIVGGGGIVLALLNRRVNAAQPGVTPDIPHYAPEQMAGD
jgi:hypothetical protein